MLALCHHRYLMHLRTCQYTAASSFARSSRYFGDASNVSLATLTESNPDSADVGGESVIIERTLMSCLSFGVVEPRMQALTSLLYWWRILLIFGLGTLALDWKELEKGEHVHTYLESLTAKNTRRLNST